MQATRGRRNQSRKKQQLLKESQMLLELQSLCSPTPTVFWGKTGQQMRVFLQECWWVFDANSHVSLPESAV